MIGWWPGSSPRGVPEGLGAVVLDLLVEDGMIRIGAHKSAAPFKSPPKYPEPNLDRFTRQKTNTESDATIAKVDISIHGCSLLGIPSSYEWNETVPCYP